MVQIDNAIQKKGSLNRNHHKGESHWELHAFMLDFTCIKVVSKRGRGINMYAHSSHEFWIHTSFSTYPTYNVPTIANKMTRRTSNASWAPVPTMLESRTKLRGGRKTSPWTSFQPDSSLTSLSWEHRWNCKENMNFQITELSLKRKKKGSSYYHQSFQIIIFPSILCIVISQSSHQDHWHQTSEKDNHHEWIENREPMDLHIATCI